MFNDSFSQNIGFRDVKVINGNGEFAIYINGKKIWVNGVNYIPAHIFYLPQDSHFNSFSSVTYPKNRSPRSLIYYFKSLLESNVNLIRVWGGGVYESDLFFSLADKYGLLLLIILFKYRHYGLARFHVLMCIISFVFTLSFIIRP